MASQDELRQTTQTQQDAPVVFRDDNLTKLDEKRIKSIGLYTESDAEALQTLFTDLHKIFTEQYGLIDRQEIILRINGETRDTRLITEVNFPEFFDKENPGQRRTRLFFSDLARIVVGLAKTVNAIWQPEELSAFGSSFDELSQLKKWANYQDEYLDELDLINNYKKVHQFFEFVTEVYERSAGIVVEQQTQEEAVETAPEPEQTTATVPVFEGPKNKTEENDESADGNETEQAPEEENDPETNRILATEVAFVSSAAYYNLVTQFLEKNGMNAANLTPEMQAQLTEIEDILRNQLWDIIEKLSPEQREKLISHTLRTYLYQKLLTELLRHPVFYSTLTSFYQNYAQFVYEEQGLAAAEEHISTIETYFDSMSADEGVQTEELNQVLEKIRARIQAWKTQILEQIRLEQQADDAEIPLTATEPTSIDHEDLDDHAVTRLAPPHVRFTPQQEAQIGAYISSAGQYDQKTQKLIQDQSARVLWGTLSELFNDKDGDLDKLPQHLKDEVYNRSLGYILSLGPTELEQLRTSPSSLIRHIKNNSYRILGDATFQHAYSQYSSTKMAQVISRVNRVEKETQWAYQQILFELFSAHNITDPTVPDDPGLQDVFDDIKEYLKEDIFAYIEEMPTEDLIHLYLHSKDRSEFLQEIYKYLNADSAFRENLSLFYNNLIEHYEKTGQTQQKQQLQQSLTKLVQFDGSVARIKASTPPPDQLLDSTLSNMLPTDSQVVFDQCETALRAMVVNEGLMGTLDMIRINDPQVLEAMFNLPMGTLGTVNIEEFRTVLSEYARVRSSQLLVNSLSASTEADLFAAGYAGLGLSGVKASDKPQVKSQKQAETLRVVEQFTKARGEEADELLAEMADPKSLKEKRSIVMKIFGSEWDTISQADQIAIYIYYDLPFNEQTLKNDINTRLPFPFEYIDFRAKKNYAEILEQLSKEYELHGRKNFNPILKADVLEGTPSATRRRELNELILAAQAYQFAQLAEAEQLILAQELGYATAEAFMKEQLVAAENAWSNHPEVAQFVESVPLIDDLIPEDLSEQVDVQNQSLWQRFSGQQATIPPRQRILNTLQQLGGQKLKNESLKKGAAMLAAKAGLNVATGGLMTVVTVGAGLLQNKKFREFIVYAGTGAVASLLYALSTLGGLLGAIMGGAFGFSALGPAGLFGAAGGGILGAYAGAQVFPQQWGGWLGFSPRQAPGIGNFFSSENPVTAAESSMRAARAGTEAQTAAASAPNIISGSQPVSASLGTPQTIQAGLAGSSGATSAGATAATAAPASTGLFTGAWGMSIGLAAPVIAIGSAVFLTAATILVITGAFIVPLPTRNSSVADEDLQNVGQPGAEFVEITKEASVTQIENNTPTQVTYTVTVSPKPGFRLLFNDVTDVVSIYGDQVPQVMPVSPFNQGYFGGEIIEDSLTIEYTMELGADTVDAIASNNIIAYFDVIDRSDYVIQRNQSYRVSESIKIGDPKLGCWPATGTITQLPYGHGSHSKPGTRADAFDIGARIGTPIYAPFDGTAERIDSVNDIWADGYGTSVRLYTTVNGASLTFIFAHMNTSDIPLGQRVTVVAGERLGQVGDTGNSTGPHLHYQVIGSIRLQDLVPEGAQVVRDYNSGQTVSVTDCLQQ